MEENMEPGTRVNNVYNFLRYVMVFINGVIFLCGSVLLGLGVWIRVGGDSFLKTVGGLSAYFMNVSLFCIVAGVVMCLLGFLGCFAALKEKRFLLLIFLLIMMALFIFELAAAVVVLAFNDVADSVIKDKGLQSIKVNYYQSEGRGVLDEGWDSVMNRFKCCGLFGYEDFFNSTFTAKTGLKYPKKCCKISTGSCDGVNTSEQVIFTKGCYAAILQEVKKNSLTLGIAAAVITGWEMACIVVALVLFVKLG